MLDTLCGNTYKRAFAHDAWQGMHEALMLLGIEHGLQGLQGPCAATAQLKLCVRTILDSESHLLGRAEEMHEVILQHKELEAAIMKKLNSHVSLEQALLDSELSPASLIQNVSAQKAFKVDRKRFAFTPTARAQLSCGF